MVSREALKRHRHSVQRTRNDIPSIHGILVLDEAETVHKLDLGDLAGAMAGKVSLDVGLSNFGREESVSVKVSSTLLARDGLEDKTGDGRRKTVERPGPAVIQCRRSSPSDILCLRDGGAHHSEAGCPDTGGWRRPQSYWRPRVTKAACDAMRWWGAAVCVLGDGASRKRRSNQDWRNTRDRLGDEDSADYIARHGSKM